MIFLDGVGTVIHPRADVLSTYLEIGQRFGSRVSAQHAAASYRKAWDAQEQIDLDAQYRTDEQRERERWRAVVRAVFSDVVDPEELFHVLWEHYRHPSAWAVYDDAQELIRFLDAQNIPWGIASNYDARLRTVVYGLDALARCRFVVISSEVGWRKPHPYFFEALCRTAGQPPGKLVYTGDHYAHDFVAARTAGLHAFWLCRPGVAAHRADSQCLRSLSELIPVVSQLSV